VDDKEGVVQRERLAGIYRLSAYFLAIITTEIPIFIISSTVYVVVSYWMSNLMRNALNFFLTLLTVLLSAYACQVIDSR